MTADTAILPAFGGIAVLLGGAAILAAVRPGRLAGLLMAGSSAAGVLLSAAALLAGGRATWSVLAIDPIAAEFLLPLCLCGAGAGLYAAASRLPPAAPGLLAAALLTVLAGDGATLLIGFGLVLSACWALGRPAAFDWSSPVLLLAPTALAVALAILATGGDLGFAAIRTAGLPDGWRALAVPVLALLATSPVLALAPARFGTGPVKAVLSGVAAPSTLYVLVRLLFDLSGPATPLGWGIPLVLAGAVLALCGGWFACHAATLAAAAAWLAPVAHGVALAGFGVALVARGADLPSLAGLAASGALLEVTASALFGTLAALAADAMAAGGGSQALDRLGGLIHRMKLTAACLFIASASGACVPMSAGFAGAWATLQAMIAAPRVGGLGIQLTILAGLTGLGLGLALSAAATVRTIGVALLGRPRTPRAAAAEEVPILARSALSVLAGLTVALGLLPGPVVRLLGGEGGTWLSLLSPGDAPGYAPWVALMLVGGLVAVALGVLGRQPPGELVPAWQDGFAAPPAWMPFGDPATQYTAPSFSQPLTALLPKLSRPARVVPLAAALAALAAGLVAATWLAQP